MAEAQDTLSLADDRARLQGENEKLREDLAEQQNAADKAASLDAERLRLERELEKSKRAAADALTAAEESDDELEKATRLNGSLQREVDDLEARLSASDQNHLATIEQFRRYKELNQSEQSRLATLEDHNAILKEKIVEYEELRKLVAADFESRDALRQAVGR